MYFNEAGNDTPIDEELSDLKSIDPHGVSNGIIVLYNDVAGNLEQLGTSSLKHVPTNGEVSNEIGD